MEQAGINAVRRYYIFLTIVIIILLSLSFIFLNKLNKNYKKSSENLTAGKEGQTEIELFINSSSKTIKKGEVFTVLIGIKSVKDVYAMDLFLSFDPRSLSFESFKAGNFFENPKEFYKKINSSKGEIIYSLGAIGGSKGKKNLLEMTFRGSNASTTSFLFIDERTIAAVKDGKKAKILFPQKAVFSIIE